VFSVSDFEQDIMVAKLKEIIRINKAKCLPIKVFFQIRRFAKRALKDQYCGNDKFYFYYPVLRAAFAGPFRALFCRKKPLSTPPQN